MESLTRQENPSLEMNVLWTLRILTVFCCMKIGFEDNPVYHITLSENY